MSIYLRWPLLAAMLPLLSACQPADGEKPAEQLSIEKINKTMLAPTCDDAEDCSKISLAYLSFPESPELSAELEQSLFAMLEGIGTGEADAAPRDLDQLAESFFASAEDDRQTNPDIPPYDASLEAEVVSDHNDLLVVELNGYVFTGGAHGMPLTEYFVVDRRTQQRIGLDDMLIDGQRDAFDAAVAHAHQRWLQEIEQNAEFAQQWPLVETDNVAPMAEDAVVKFNAYDIAPYALGQPELHLPYAALEGIFAERYLP